MCSSVTLSLQPSLSLQQFVKNINKALPYQYGLLSAPYCLALGQPVPASRLCLDGPVCPRVLCYLVTPCPQLSDRLKESSGLVDHLTVTRVGLTPLSACYILSGNVTSAHSSSTWSWPSLTRCAYWFFEGRVLDFFECFQKKKKSSL